jgi:hypothetical protein
VSFLRQHRFVLSFLALLVFCSVMVVRQLNARQSKHVELREALILLQTGGYTNEAERLYRRLVRELDQLPNRALIEDWQRTVTLADPSASHPENPIWKYYWTVRQEMEKRAESTIQQARKLAEEEK